MIATKPRNLTVNGTGQTVPYLERAIRDYVRTYAWLHGRRKTAEGLGVSRHTLWRFLERDHMGSAVPSAVLSSVGVTMAALEAATLEIIIDLAGCGKRARRTDVVGGASSSPTISVIS